MIWSWVITWSVCVSALSRCLLVPNLLREDVRSPGGDHGGQWRVVWRNPQGNAFICGPNWVKKDSLAVKNDSLLYIIFVFHSGWTSGWWIRERSNCGHPHEPDWIWKGVVEVPERVHFSRHRETLPWILPKGTVNRIPQRQTNSTER